jgi:predicted nucleic acid-binding protein
MPERSQAIVTNTTPLISLAAATGSLDVPQFLYRRVVVPYEVAQEVRAGGRHAFGVEVFQGADWLDIQPAPVNLLPFLQNSLDRGEASVIQTAMNLGLPLVCIDETAGRRIARLCDLTLTGSIGVLLKAKRLGYDISITDAIERMRQQGIWLSDRVVQFALTH